MVVNVTVEERVQSIIENIDENTENSQNLCHIFLADQIHQAETAARRKALEEAAAVAGTLAERPYDSEPEFSCATTIEAHIRALIKEVK